MSFDSQYFTYPDVTISWSILTGQPVPWLYTLLSNQLTIDDILKFMDRIKFQCYVKMGMKKLYNMLHVL